MTPQQIITGISDKGRMLTQKNEELLSLSEKKAHATRELNIAVAKTTLQLKQDGHPITLIPTLVKGDDMVAGLKFQADLADGIYEACRESIKDIREQIGAYRSLLTWLRAEMTGGD